MLATFLAAVPPPMVAAQTPAQELSDEQLIRRIEALVPEYEAALSARDARLRSLRVIERPPTSADTVQVGSLRIVTFEDEADQARSLFEEVWREDFAGLQVSPSLQRHVFVFQWRTRLRELVVATEPDQQMIRLDLGRVRTPTAEHAKAEIRNALSRAFVMDFPRGSPTASWLTAQGDPPSPETYRALALTNIGATRECLNGSTGACGAALGFGYDEAGAAVAEWFTPQHRREMVQRTMELRGRIDGDDPLARSCIDVNDAQACDALLARLGWVHWVPVSDRLRAHALWFAVRSGGDDAWRRALERADAPVPDVLEYVSGLPLADLLAAWRGELVENRPDARAGLDGRGLRVLLWSMVFAAFAMRSTRWRVA
jgi:hypothetical protein